MDQIRNRFGLGEVNAAVEKRPLGKLAWFSQTRTVCQHRVEHLLRGENAAVAGDLDHVFARERARRAHHREQHFVHRPSGPLDLAVMNRVRLRSRRPQGVFAGRHETLVRHRQRLRAGQSDDRQTAFAQWRRNRSDGVVKHVVNFE